MNGKDRITKNMSGDYSNYIQKFNHHTNCNLNGINVYSFALYPESIHPSGSCNFSMIDDCLLENNLKSF